MNVSEKTNSRQGETRLDTQTSKEPPKPSANKSSSSSATGEPANDIIGRVVITTGRHGAGELKHSEFAESTGKRGETDPSEPHKESIEEGNHEHARDEEQSAAGDAASVAHVTVEEIRPRDFGNEGLLSTAISN